MKLPIFAAMLSTVGLAFVQVPCAAEDAAQYPNRAIRFIVPNPPGGLPDTITRIVSQRMHERMGVPVVVENRPGANAGIGTAASIDAPADGYTFLMTDGSILSINPLLYTKLPYDPKKLAPVSMVARAPIFLAVHPKLPISDLQQFIAYARSHPGELSYGSIGTGSFHHLSMEAIKSALGLDLVHVPFKGSGESVNALLGGHVDLLFASYAALRGAVEIKKIKLLATNAGRRSPQEPDVPSVAEAIPGYDLAVIQGVFARSDTPKTIIERVAAELTEIVKEPDIARRFAEAGIEAAAAGPEDFRQALDAEARRVSEIVLKARITAAH